MKLDACGNVLWTQRYKLPGWQFASQVAQTDDGGFLLTGFSMSSLPREADTWLAHCTPGGGLEWVGFLVASFVQLVNGRSYDAIILRTDG